MWSEPGVLAPLGVVWDYMRLVHPPVRADAILTLAGLGYLGLGIQPPDTDWGSMLSNGVQFVNNGNWWLIYPPGIAIVLVVVAFNFIGDAARDAVDVRLVRR